MECDGMMILFLFGQVETADGRESVHVWTVNA